MIELFHIPSYQIDTSRFSNLLHDKIVKDFEQRFADYVGCRYAVSFNSATSAIFLLCQLIKGKSYQLLIPCIIPPVVCNAIINAGMHFSFVDNTKWIGSTYPMGQFDNTLILDAAQECHKNIFKEQCNDDDAMIFSFYPTKPVGSCDGGMICTNNAVIASELKLLSMNGMSQQVNNWERQVIKPGYKMYMNSLQAYIANENLSRLEAKNARLADICKYYNDCLGLKNNSRHLYRINVNNQKEFMAKAAAAGIATGIHYHAAHLIEPYKQYAGTILPQSTRQALHTVSIPFHEELTTRQLKYVIDFVQENMIK
jgi:dTDP-4-amino-4,6-dideoxygalactose transaminase